jgi:hypothetical protein
MRNLFLKFLMAFSLIAILATSCKDKNSNKEEAAAAEVKADSTNSTAEIEGTVAAMEFETMEHDFGTLQEGDVVEYTYNFKNTGEVPLIIQDVKGSCGCTVPDWSKEPVAVGAAGFIKAKFDSKGKTGSQNKKVTVTANTSPKQTVLSFTAMITEKPAEKK